MVTVKKLIGWLKSADPNKRVVLCVENKDASYFQDLTSFKESVNPMNDFILLTGEYYE